MRYRITVILTAFVLTFLSINLKAVAQEQPEPSKPAKEYFLGLRKTILDGLPVSFTGELTGKSIEQKLKNIPKDAYLDKKKRIYVRLQYSKKSGIRLAVQNVEELYRDLYSDLPRQIFAFDLILSSEKNDTMLNRYAYSYQSRKDNLIILKLTIKSAENALMIYATPRDNRIQRMDYMLGNQLLSSTIIVYQTVKSSSGKESQIPVRFLTKTFDGPDSRPEVLDIRNVQAR